MKVKKRMDKSGKKKVIIIILVVVLVILIALAGVFIYLKYKDNKLLESIKNHYGNSIEVVNDTKLYTKNKKAIGKAYKGLFLELDKKSIKDSKDQYFKIKNTDYYIFYNDVKRTKAVVNETINSKYIVFNKNLNLNKALFYKNNKKILEVNGEFSFPIQYMDTEYYYVSYLNNLFQVKKGDNDNIVDAENTSDNEASYISVLSYDQIDSCNKNTCVSIDKVREQLKYLKEDGFYSITINEYGQWLDGNIRLREGAILVTTNTNNSNLGVINTESDIKIELLDNSSLKFSVANRKSTKSSPKDNIESYLVKNSTSLEDFKKMSKGEDVVEYVAPSNSEQKIAVLNYHFFYDPTIGETCDENICLEVSKFREHLDYLKNNGYRTLKMSEFKQWMYGEIELPDKSVLITVDDGAMGTGAHNGNKLIPLLEEYNMNATLFLISGWWDINNYRSKNLDVQSHTFDMHLYGSCGRGQLVCASKEEAVADLTKSLQIVDNNDSFCYPFYSYSDVAISAVKEAGFKLAFAGGSRKARRSNNKYLIPRYPIHKSITLDQFIGMVS